MRRDDTPSQRVMQRPKKMVPTILNEVIKSRGKLERGREREREMKRKKTQQEQRRNG